MTDFFISYSSSDRPWAEWIAQVLDQADFDTVLQAWDFAPGANWMEEMANATEEADRTIAVVSPEYLKSSYCRVEWLTRLAQDPLGTDRKLLPILVEACDLPAFLETIVHVDLTGLREGDARERLLASLRRERIGAGTAAHYPHQKKAFQAVQTGFPGCWPLIWTVNRMWNRDFTGREDHLRHLRTALKEGDPSARSEPQAVHGLGGVGKTALALEYAYRYRHKYGVVHWIRAGDTSQLMQDYARLGSDLGLEFSAEIKPRSVVSAVRRWLESNRHWLLVFDNADGPDELEDYLPRLGTGHVIITTRNPEWLGIARAFHLNVLSSEEAVQYLLKSSWELNPDEGSAVQLAEALGRLPLALAQARAYVHTRRLSMSAYLKVFCESGRELLQRGDPPRGSDATVANCWAISLAAATKKMPAAKDLMKLLSFLAPQDLPRDLPERWPDCLPKGLRDVAADYLTLQDCFAELWRYSLVELTGSVLSVHPLIQMATLQEIPNEEKPVWAEAATKLVERAFPAEPDDPSELPTCLSLIAHALVAAEHSERLCAPNEVTGQLLYRGGLYLRTIGDFRRSKEVLEKALSILTRTCGTNHPSISKVLDLLGGVLIDLGDPRSAVEKRNRALEIMKTLHTDRDPALVPAILSLARTRRQLRQLDETVKLLREALSIETGMELGKLDTRSVAGTVFEGAGTLVENEGLQLSRMEHRDDSDVTYLLDCTRLLQHTGNARKESENLRASMTAPGLGAGPDPRIMLSILNMMGLVLLDLENYSAARDSFEQMMAVAEQFPDPRKRQRWLARTFNNLGSVHRRLGDLDAARASIAKSIEIASEYYGSDHHKVATRLNNLGSVLSKLGKIEEAKKCFENALKIFLKRYGEDHSRVQTVRRHLERL